MLHLGIVTEHEPMFLYTSIPLHETQIFTKLYLRIFVIVPRVRVRSVYEKKKNHES